jgi:hypothetical protein
MPRFRVTFRKVVYGDTGHACAICQRIVDVEAHDSGSAQAAAIESFCDLENVSSWLNHADWMEVARLQPVLARPSVNDGRARRAA